jgi:predicted glycosyltransferase
MSSRAPPRFLLYSHDGLGLGHVTRNLAIASSLVRLAPTSSVLLVTGAGAAARLGPERGVEVLRLPALRPDLRALRAEQISAAVISFRPDVMLVDEHPTGACGELLVPLRTLNQVGGLAVLGLPDVLDDPAEVRRRWRRAGTLKLIKASYDDVLVYGMPGLLDLEGSYGLCSGRKCEVRHTGYVVHMAPSPDTAVDGMPPLLLAPRRSPVVLAMVGGGEHGDRMLQAFIEAARGSIWRGLVVAGPDVPRDQRHSLRRGAVSAGVAFRGFAQDLASWLREVDAVVCTGGYNTLAEALFRGTPTVCVPRVSPRTAQLVRARAFESLGLLRLLEPSALDAASLRIAVATALDSSRPQLARRALLTLDFHGAWRAAEWLLRLARPPGEEAPGALQEKDALPRSTT